MVDPDKAIMSSAMVTLASTTAATMMPKEYGGQGSLPHIRVLIGTSLAFMGLSIMGDFAPKIAVGLGVSVAITALTYYGIPVAEAFFVPTQETPGPAAGTKAAQFHKPTTPSGKVLPT